MKATIKQLEIYYLMRRYFGSRNFPGDYHHISLENTMQVDLWKFDINGNKHAISIDNRMVRLYKVKNNGLFDEIQSEYKGNL